MILVRPALDGDIPGIAALAAELVRYHHGLDPLRFMTAPTVEEGYRRFLRGELRSGDVVLLVAVRESPIAEQAPRIVGYTYSRVETRNWNDLLDRSGKIQDVFVAAHERRQGIARKLVLETLRHLEELGVPRIVLHTAAQNAAGQRLFASLGFRTTMYEMTRENTRPTRPTRRSTIPPPPR